MKRYVDGFVLPIPKDRVTDYRAIAQAASGIWKEHGALEYWECVGDDLEVEGTRSFAEMTNMSQEETVIFAWVVFESRDARDAANDKIMTDPRLANLMDPDDPIFDVGRMAQGGFEELVHE